MANFDLQIRVSTFLAATLADLRSRQTCPPPAQTIGGIQFLVQQIEFGTNSIRHEKPTTFPVFYEAQGQTRGFQVDGFQTQIAQTVVLHVTRADDVLAHPNGPPASVQQFTVVAVLDLTYYPFDTQCLMTTSLADVEFGALPPLPPGVDPEQFKTIVTGLIGRAAGSPARPLNFANMLPFGGDSKVLNAGVTVSRDRNLLVFRAEIGLGSDRDAPWSNFYGGFVIDHLAAPADWGLFIEKKMIEQTFATTAWQALAKEVPEELDLISVGAEYSPAGDKANIVLRVNANVDLPDPAGTSYVESTARIELSVPPTDRRLTTDVFLPDIKVIANQALTTTRAWMTFLLGPLVHFAEGLLDSAIAKLETPTDIGIPRCFEAAPGHQRCAAALPLPAFTGGMQPRLTTLLALPDGIALTGVLPAPAFTPSTLQSSIGRFRWEPPEISCGSADGAFAAQFGSQVKKLAPLRGEVFLGQIGTSPAYLCGVEVLNDPLNVFPASALRWDGAELPVTITLEVPNPGDEYAAAPYPADLLVRTTLGARLIRFSPAPPLTQEDRTRLVAAVIGQIANCKLLTGPRWDLRWLPDPPFDMAVLHRWQLAFEGLRPRETLRLLDSTGRQLVQVTARPEGTAIMHAFVPPVGAKELRLLREAPGGSGTSPVTVGIRQQLVRPAATISLDAPCRSVFPSSLWSARGLVAVLEDGIAAFDLSSPAVPRRIGRWQIDGLRGVRNWAGGLLAFSGDGFVTIDGDLRMAPVGPSLEPSPILDAAPGDRIVHVLTANALEVRSHRLAVRSQEPSDGARCMLRLGSRLLTGGARGITVRRLTATGHDDGVRSLPTLSVTRLAPAPDDHAVLVTLEDGSVRLAIIEADGRMREIGQYPGAPWFAGSSSIGDALVVVGDGARSLQVNLLGHARPVGADAMDAVAPGLKFTDWTAIDDSRAEGRLQNVPVTLVGPLGTGSVTNGTFRLYDSDDFSPRLPVSDTVNLVGRDGHSFTLTFGSPVQNVLLHFASLASEIPFSAETAVAKVSGEPTLTVSGSKVRGAATEANGTVRLFGTFSTLRFTATPIVSGKGDQDDIYLQVGGIVPATAQAVPDLG